MKNMDAAAMTRKPTAISKMYTDMSHQDDGRSGCGFISG